MIREHGISAKRELSLVEGSSKAIPKSREWKHFWFWIARASMSMTLISKVVLNASKKGNSNLVGNRSTTSWLSSFKCKGNADER
jgi:hypothetical protein